MEQTKLVPKRRFKEFQNAHAWEQRKLSDITDSIGTGKSSFIKHEKSADNPYAILGSTSIIGYDSEFDHEGDFILTARVGANAGNLYRYYGKAKITDNTVFIKGKNLSFLYPLLDHFDLRKLSFGTGQPLVKASELKNLQIKTPSYEEQIQVGNFFNQLDYLVTLHQRKLEKTKALKSAYLSEMFPAEGERVPKRRFAGFTQAWEQRKWEDTVDISTNMVDPRTGLYDELPHIGPGNIESFTGKILDNVLKVKDSNLISGKFHFYKGDIIYGKINPQLGKYAIAPCEGLASADSYILNAKNGVVQNFLYSILQTKDFYKYSVSVSSRTGMPKINRDELNVYNYKVPEIEEQKKIGSFFVGLDNFITLHQRKLEKLQSIKKAYLNEMFV
ncbi:Type I restriction-modification system, specificity subunit S [Heyndrickxia coagulans]|uniref:Type I restriction-modification system, specificity subunit S n=1 Tax=Heyndrickxia coagulans TaxID=1398 RepID=A0A150JY55_HEYCO|nr:restriction endonuclease subunit S [Heyndrickxia coagulans]KYC62220.1 Type I restriction-modification system, specificity subunit S [Heyndrickxia coagulans]